MTSIINDNVNVSAMQSTTGDACVVTGDLPYMKEHVLLSFSIWIPILISAETM